MIHLTLKSGNVKTGPIPVSTSDNSTCPDSCPLKAGGCYAKGGPLGMHWRKVSAGQRGEMLEQFARKIEQLPDGQLWRHNQAGDLPGKGDLIDHKGLARIVRANKGKRGFTYTHKPPLHARHARAIVDANANGFTVNLSANSLSHADTLKSCDLGPVVSIVPEGTPESGITPKGNKFVVCPAQTRDNVTCSSCKLCSRADRSVIVAFLPHGSASRKANAIASK
jgi:hypothetical protein